MNFRLLLILCLPCFLSGCFLTKVVTVPMRAVGAVTSVVPVVGDATHTGIDAAAGGVDMIPL
jgi:hypothetical protein